MAPNKSWSRMEEDLRRITKGNLRVEEPMAGHTTIGVGGTARLMALPRSEAELCRIMRYAHRVRLPVFPLGKGSNLLVRDGGYDGLVIKLATELGKVSVGKRTVRAGGGASFARLSRTMTKRGRTGMEFGIGIPGTVGGAVRMNAGAFGGEVSDILVRVKIVDHRGRVGTLRAGEIEFGYRKSSLPPDAVVLSATFNCKPGEIDQETYHRSLTRKDSQPIWQRTFGSTFVNPEGGFAAEMIEGCGLKGHRIGGCMISDKHANFIVKAGDGARARDVEQLIRLARREVKKKFGVSLKTEVVIIGNR